MELNKIKECVHKEQIKDESTAKIIKELFLINKDEKDLDYRLKKMEDLINKKVI